MLLFYVRHGDPIYDPDSLTPLGHRQAEAVAKRLSLYGIDRIFASTSNRAIQTATPTSEIVKKNITTLDFCNEGHAWSLFTVTDKNGFECWAYLENEVSSLFLSEEIYKLRDKWYEHPDLKGYRFKEWYDTFEPQMEEFVASLGFKKDKQSRSYRVLKPNSERVALFAHEGFGMIFLSWLLDIPYPMFCTHFGLNHTGMTVIHFDEAKEYTAPAVLTLSNDSHIYREGLPTKYNGEFIY